MPIRVQLSRKKGWRMPANTMSVALPTLFGNPYAVGKPYREAHGKTFYVTDRAQAVNLFERAIEGRLPADYLYADPQAWQLFAARVKRELRGKNLACWCSLYVSCHGDVLLRLANLPESESFAAPSTDVPLGRLDTAK
jgi:hypothetical protein